jgi:hypothetical protein
MIPDDITREHVLEAMTRIDRDGIPAGRNGLKFAVWHEGRQYPPKLLISIAHEVGFGRTLPRALFSGGLESNGFLQGLGFTIAEVDGRAAATGRRLRRPSALGSAVRAGTRTADVEEVLRQLTETRPLYRWRDIAQSKVLPPTLGGVYAWFFTAVPSVISTDQCRRRDDMTLLYLGISPESALSRASLRSRIRYHYRGNAEGSTLRRSLGCVLQDTLGTTRRRVGSSGKRLTFGPEEARLTEWMAENAAVAWVEMAEPWRSEGHLISRLALPLNIEMNAAHSFCSALRQLRLTARQRANLLPILSGH